MEQYIIPAICGLLAGLAGTIIAPWIHWGIEKRRIKYEAQRNFIRLVRTEMSNPVPERELFREKPIYSQLRPHLSENTRKMIESEDVYVQSGGRGGGANNYAPLVLDDLLRLEKSWDLL